jgi:hypothetical protein
MVEKAECRVASLLDLCNNEPRAYGMDCAGGYENDIVLEDAMPIEPGLKSSRHRSRPELRGREWSLQPDCNLSLGRRGKDVPRLGLTMPKPHQLREGIVRMNLDGQRTFVKSSLRKAESGALTSGR